MPSLPSLSSVPKTLGIEHDASKTSKYREAAYHQDGQGRYVAQSYEVRRPLSPPSPAPMLSKHRMKLPKRSLKQSSIVVLELPCPRRIPEQSINLDQPREGPQQRPSGPTPSKIEVIKAAAPPSTPRPRRLPTPELSDIESERPFCGCDIKKHSLKSCISHY
jgi:hypothetical protein